MTRCSEVQESSRTSKDRYCIENGMCNDGGGCPEVFALQAKYYSHQKNANQDKANSILVVEQRKEY